ncbi:MAG: PhoH family protein [Eggerthellaceae bacterium]|nr:PhoH family protein [Eggerthellaceae bacterium]
MQPTSTYTIIIPDEINPAKITGTADAFLRMIQQAYRARITFRGNIITIEGDETEISSLTQVFNELIQFVLSGQELTEQVVLQTLEILRQGVYAPTELQNDIILSYRGKVIRPKTTGQKAYIDAIRKHIITFGIGPAGTGKTYLAMAQAVAALKKRVVKRIILTRPVVEAGENLGFLPGTLTEKIDPYLRPLYDALFEMTDGEHAGHFLEDGTVEVAPLAFMRGRTFNDAYLILDEAQNATPEQLKMFLTRLGFNSKMIITADATQSDLPGGAQGLHRAESALRDVDEIAFCKLERSDVVRHSLVAKIVAAYERDYRTVANQKRDAYEQRQ